MSSPVRNQVTTPATTPEAESTSGPSGAASLNGSGATTPVSQMFLQVLLEELSHQDPTNATDPTTMVTQLAQMTDVEETAQASQTTQFQTALQLVGQSVTYQDPTSGDTVQGSVTGAAVGTSGPMLTINNEKIPFGNLVSVP